MRVIDFNRVNRMIWAGTGRVPLRPFPGPYPYRICLRLSAPLGGRYELLYMGKPTEGAYKWMLRYIRKNGQMLARAGRMIQYLEYVQTGLLYSGSVIYDEADYSRINGQCIANYHQWKFTGYGSHPVDGRMYVNLRDTVVPFRRGKNTVMVCLPYLDAYNYQITEDGHYLPTTGRLKQVLRNCVRNR